MIMQSTAYNSSVGIRWNPS